jgi:phosphoglycerate dehydrogenase-like enzyme
MAELPGNSTPERDSDRTPIVAGVALSDDQIARILAAGGEVLWHGFAGSPHGSLLSLSELPGLETVVGEAEVWFGPGLSGETLARAPKVTWLQTNSAGVEGFLSPQVVDSSLVVTNIKGMHSSTTGEHALALMLALARGLPGSVLSQSRGLWNPTPIDDIAAMSGTRLLILGTGMIGQAIASRAAAFGMSVHGVSRGGRPAAGFE